MRVSEIRDLIRVKPIERDATRRRLSACHDIADLRSIGRRLTPRPVFDYVDGGADEEVSLRANVRAFQRIRLIRWAFRAATNARSCGVNPAASNRSSGSATPMSNG